MGRQCSICTSPKRAQLDAELAGGEPVGAIATRHRVSRDALRRHKGAHLSPALAKVAIERFGEESARGAFDATVDRLEGLIDRLDALLAVAEKRASITGGANVARELRQCLELVARLRGELDDRPQTTVVNVLSSPEVTGLVGRLVVALAPWPEARVAAASVIDVEEIAS